MIISSKDRSEPSQALHRTGKKPSSALCSFSPRTAVSVPSSVPSKTTVASKFGSGVGSVGNGHGLISLVDTRSDISASDFLYALLTGDMRSAAL